MDGLQSKEQTPPMFELQEVEADEKEAAEGGGCSSTGGGGKLGKQGGLTHKNRENSFTKPGGVMEDLLKEHWVSTN